jgi:hypothetical protein
MNLFNRTQFTVQKSRRPAARYLTLAGLLLLAASLSGCKADRPAPGTVPASATPAAHTHANAGETCFICDPSKRDAGRLWCKEHARYEDRCWECQPQLRDPKRPYCEEHGLYEDECFLCDPSRAKGGTP